MASDLTNSGLSKGQLVGMRQNLKLVPSYSWGTTLLVLMQCGIGIRGVPPTIMLGHDPQVYCLSN